MINYTIDYIMYTSGHRHHHAGTQTHIIPSAPGISSPGEHFPVFAPPMLPYNNTNLPFAFMSIVGNADDNHLYTTSGTKDVKAGSTNIAITVIYAPVGGVGPGIPGVWVYAFNVDLGPFSDSDFMQVYTNHALDVAKTATANNDGIVASQTVEDLRSLSQVDGVPFLKWEKIANPNADIATIDYNLQVNEGGLVFAFYQTPKKVPVHPPKETGNEVWIYVSPSVMSDGSGIVIGPDGKIHHVGPWGPVMTEMLQTVVSTEARIRITAEQGKEAQQAAIKQFELIRSEMR
ncbi:MAG: hypothetical protein JST06_06995 [Bacteroidetes bacterium]|nr:hypothetical protein [Bacteroidota bacterium]